jgi:hypothetical protein
MTSNRAPHSHHPLETATPGLRTKHYEWEPPPPRHQYTLWGEAADFIAYTTSPPAAKLADLTPCRTPSWWHLSQYFLYPSSSPREILVAERAATVKQASQLTNTTPTLERGDRRSDGQTDRPTDRPAGWLAGWPGSAASTVHDMAATLSRPPAQNYTQFRFGTQDTKLPLLLLCTRLFKECNKTLKTSVVFV